ncbi:MAG: hypothetical protein LBS33_06490, partial [Streptococcaceae bacterium]|nr:hypothetical protein [Streptococcaceae bacterium]
SVPFNRNGVTRFDNAKWLILEDDTTNHKAKIIRTTPLTYAEAGVTPPVAEGGGDATGTDASAMLTFLPTDSSGYDTYFDSSGNNNYGKTGDGGVAISPVRKAVENYYTNMTNTADKARVLAIKQDYPNFATFSYNQGLTIREGEDSGSATATNWKRDYDAAGLDNRYSTILDSSGGTLTAFVPTISDILGGSSVELTNKGNFLHGAATISTWLASPGDQDNSVLILHRGMFPADAKITETDEGTTIHETSPVHPAFWISY